MSKPETDKQRFFRNHYENVRLMRARAIELEREGSFSDAAAVRQIADAWSGLDRFDDNEPDGDAA